MKKFQFIEVKSELGAGTRGASLGAEAIKLAAIAQKSLLFGSENEVLLESSYEKLIKKVAFPFCKRIEAITELNSNLCDLVYKINTQKQFPICLLGDHSSSIGTVSGLKKAFPDKEIGLIWIDAHADLHSPYTTPSGNMHGMPIAALLNTDNLSNKVNEPDEEALKLWGDLKELSGKEAALLPKHLIYVGVRDTEEQEDALIKELNITNINVKDFRRIGTLEVVKRIEQLLSDCDLIHISLDVDCLDPSISTGTGTPAPGGFNIEEVSALTRGIISSMKNKIAAFEVVEVNPILDTENKMANIAFEILKEATDQLRDE